MAYFRVLLVEFMLVRLKHNGAFQGVKREFSHVGNIKSKVPA
jgi:hypothetical protein